MQVTLVYHILVVRHAISHALVRINAIDIATFDTGGVRDGHRMFAQSIRLELLQRKCIGFKGKESRDKWNTGAGGGGYTANISRKEKER